MPSLLPKNPLLKKPSHTVYGGADRFRGDICAKLGAKALEFFEAVAKNATEFNVALDLPPALHISQHVYEKVREKLRQDAIEDFRIDFEDGFGQRSDKEEDAACVSSAAVLKELIAVKRAPSCIGIRIKSFHRSSKARGKRSLEHFFAEFFRGKQKRLPENFVVTLPKVTTEKEVTEFSGCLAALERKFKLKAYAIRAEILAETPEAYGLIRGELAMRRFVAAGKGRIVGVHFGVHDFCSSLGLASQTQHLRHQYCDFARYQMLLALAGTGVRIVDSITNVIPQQEQAGAINAKREVFLNVRHALEHGVYQGWDIHPNQLPFRFAATYGFFEREVPLCLRRLQEFETAKGQAVKSGQTFDDEATIRGAKICLEQAKDSGYLSDS